MPRSKTAPRPAAVLAATIAVSAVGMLGGTSAGAATSCPDVDATPSSVGVGRATAALGCLVNHERASAGLAPVRNDARATTAAQRYAADMAGRAFYSHLSPEGLDAGARLLLSGLDWLAYGENLARGQTTPRAALAGWLASPDHCTTLLTPMYTVAGYGVAASPNGFHWVQEFARPVAAGVLSRFVATPRCPRSPTPFSAAPVVPPTAAPAAPVRVLTAVSRSARILRVRLRIPGATGTPRVVVRVRQGSRTVRTVTLRRAAGSTQRLRLRLPAARSGRLSVRVGSGPTVSRRFR